MVAGIILSSVLVIVVFGLISLFADFIWRQFLSVYPRASVHFFKLDMMAKLELK